MDKKNLSVPVPVSPTADLYTLRTFGNDLAKRWYFEYQVDGKRRKKYGNLNQFSTVRERHAAAQQLLSKIVATPVRRSLRKTSEAWLETNAPRWRKKSYQSIKSKITVFFDWLGVRTLNTSALADFLAHITAQGRSNTTYNNYIRVLKLVDSECWKIPNLFDGIKKRRAEPVPAKYFTRSQINHLRTHFERDAPELLLFVQFVYYTFIRPGELRFLRWEDVALEERRIVVRAEISKNRKEQYVRVPDAFMPVLESAAVGTLPTDYVFGGEHHRRKDYHSRQHQKLIRALRYDTRRYKLYSWKHTGVVAVAQAGVPIKQLQVQLRHHSLDQVDMYLRQLGIEDLANLERDFPML